MGEELIVRLKNPLGVHTRAPFLLPQVVKDEIVRDMVEAAEEIIRLRAELAEGKQRKGLSAKVSAEIARLRAKLAASQEREEAIRISNLNLRQALAAAQEQAERMRAVLGPLLEHYLECYDGIHDQLAHDARAALKGATAEGRA
jgi:hypothetical protein